MRASEVKGCALAVDATRRSTLFDAPTFGALPAPDGLVGRWEDTSGNARHVQQITSARRPTLRAAGLNGRPSLEFGGERILVTTSIVATTAFLESGTDGYYCAAVNVDSAGGEPTLFSIGAARPVSVNRYVCFPYVGGQHRTDWYDGVPGVGSHTVAAAGGWRDVPRVLSGRRVGSLSEIRSEAALMGSINTISGAVTSLENVFGIGHTPEFVGVFALGLVGQIGYLGCWRGVISQPCRQRIEHAVLRRWGIASARA